MSIEKLKARIEHYNAMEADVIARKDAATTDAQRLELERMHRFIQVATFAATDRLLRETSRDHAGRPERPTARPQDTA